jgi:branched-chain amino acid transport system permease protein
LESIFPDFVFQALHGLACGCLLFVASAGLTLVSGMMGVLNIAHASFSMLGAYFSYPMLKIVDNFWVGLIGGQISVSLPQF